MGLKLNLIPVPLVVTLATGMKYDNLPNYLTISTDQEKIVQLCNYTNEKGIRKLFIGYNNVDLPCITSILQDPNGSFMRSVRISEKSSKRRFMYTNISTIRKTIQCNRNKNGI